MIAFYYTNVPNTGKKSLKIRTRNILVTNVIIKQNKNISSGGILNASMKVFPIPVISVTSNLIKNNIYLDMYKKFMRAFHILVIGVISEQEGNILLGTTLKSMMLLSNHVINVTTKLLC